MEYETSDKAFNATKDLLDLMVAAGIPRQVAVDTVEKASKNLVRIGIEINQSVVQDMVAVCREAVSTAFTPEGVAPWLAPLKEPFLKAVGPGVVEALDKYAGEQGSEKLSKAWGELGEAFVAQLGIIIDTGMEERS